jgi:hypothetical protein
MCVITLGSIRPRRPTLSGPCTGATRSPDPNGRRCSRSRTEHRFRSAASNVATTAVHGADDVAGDLRALRRTPCGHPSRTEPRGRSRTAAPCTHQSTMHCATPTRQNVMRPACPIRRHEPCRTAPSRRLVSAFGETCGPHIRNTNLRCVRSGHRESSLTGSSSSTPIHLPAGFPGTEKGCSRTASSGTIVGIGCGRTWGASECLDGRSGS